MHAGKLGQARDILRIGRFRELHGIGRLFAEQWEYSWPPEEDQFLEAVVDRWMAQQAQLTLATDGQVSDFGYHLRPRADTIIDAVWCSLAIGFEAIHFPGVTLGLHVCAAMDERCKSPTFFSDRTKVAEGRDVFCSSTCKERTKKRRQRAKDKEQNDGR